MKAITPNEARTKKAEALPDFVINAFNNLLIKNYNETVIYIKKNEAINEILKLSNDETLTRQDIFDNHWLDIEPLYRGYGWEVDYDRPGYNETYEGFFKFVPKSK